jgi:hypothetical protein
MNSPLTVDVTLFEKGGKEIFASGFERKVEGSL